MRTADFIQELYLPFRFHAFGDDADANLISHADDRFHNIRSPLRRFQMVQELHVHLQNIDAHVLQRAEG